MIPCTGGVYGSVQNGLTAEDAFCTAVWGNAHSEWGSEGALAGANIRYMPQLKVEVDVDAPQLGICCPTLHGAALDASWVQLDQT